MSLQAGPLSLREEVIMTEQQSRKRLRAAIATTALVCLFLLCSRQADAVPSFARQTGYRCSQCHTTPPELTQEGRDFKLNGYTLKTVPSITSETNNKTAAFDMLSNLPVSAWFQASYTSTNSAQPDSQNGNVEFPQTLSLFLAGAWSTNVGSFLQVTYSGANDHFSLDNTDIRYANVTRLFGEDLHYGITLNNNPTLEDLWHGTPAWGFPFFANDVAPTPAASAVIDGNLAQDVAGLGVYGLWKNQLYVATTLYRSEHLGASQPLTGKDATYNIKGAAPYWRVAWQHPSKNNYFEVGTYGIHVSSTPDAISGPTDRFTDMAADFQYDRTVPGVASDFFCKTPPCNDVLSFRGTYIHESSTLDATFGAAGAAQADHTLDTVKLNGEYHFGDRASIAAGWFTTTGTVDPVLFAEAPVSGSANGDPRSTGYILNLSWWPAMNVNLGLQYTGYTSFNGGSTNYDGSGRNASGNNSVYLTASFLF